jgi:hypothetical protein
MYISKLTIRSKGVDMESVLVGQSVWCMSVSTLHNRQFSCTCLVLFIKIVFRNDMLSSMLKVVVFVNQFWTIINYLWISVCLTPNTEMECHLNYLFNSLYWTTTQRCSDTNRKKHIIFYNPFRWSDILRDMAHQFSRRL